MFSEFEPAGLLFSFSKLCHLSVGLWGLFFFFVCFLVGWVLWVWGFFEGFVYLGIFLNEKALPWFSEFSRMWSTNPLTVLIELFS